MKMRTLTLLQLLILTAVAPACSVAKDVTTQPVGLQLQFIKRFNSIGGGSADKIKDDVELKSIVDTFRAATLDAAESARSAQFVVLDEDGRALQNVAVEINRVRIVGILDPGLKGENEKFVVKGQFTVEWPRNDSTLELKVSKEGYRPVQFSFRPRSDEESRKQDSAQELLSRGFLREPLTAGGPMRVIMPPRFIWVPDKIYRFQHDRAPGGWGQQDQRPDKIDRSSTPIITSADGGAVAVERRGTYGLVDRRGTVLEMVRLDVGSILVLTKATNGDGPPLIGMSHPGGGTFYEANPDAEPYQWQLVGEPTVYVVPPASAKPDRGKRSTTQPATDSSKKHPSGT